MKIGLNLYSLSQAIKAGDMDLLQAIEWMATLEIQAVAPAMDNAIPPALSISELATSVYKLASPPAGRGEIFICFAELETSEFEFQLTGRTINRTLQSGLLSDRVESIVDTDNICQRISRPLGLIYFLIKAATALISPLIWSILTS